MDQQTLVEQLTQLTGGLSPVDGIPPRRSCPGSWMSPGGVRGSGTMAGHRTLSRITAGMPFRQRSRAMAYSVGKCTIAQRP